MSADMAALQAEYEANAATYELPHRLAEIADELHGIREQIRIGNILKNRELSLEWDCEHDPDGKIAEALGLKETE